MATERQKRAAHLSALKMDLKRKKAKLAGTGKNLEVTSSPYRRDLLTPQHKYWQDQVKILETAISKAEEPGKAPKTKVK